ncbi:uncharacterized protein LOC122374217 isoform X1 [Amphibalanus amphitrite]|uniref:uncharacterized protein LOC122374217 isoform X1 n=2 Tax=Amphibalanus amphitrite TaxID=1232801 RepID=UPI001C910B20|nr:uncharacterized protein LOC122374217 isoform X1 [Amphibalanus amphitrite]
MNSGNKRTRKKSGAQNRAAKKRKELLSSASCNRSILEFCRVMRLLVLVLVPLLLAGRCAGGPLVLPSGGVSPSRQVAPSQGILGELQQLFREAAAGQQQVEYGAAREELEQMVASLDQLAAVVPLGQQDAPGSETVTVSTTTEEPANVPIIDPGLFVIQGVKTCGDGAGYCMLGANCSADSDFSADPSGHCVGLRTAFSPPADFSCCQFEAARRRTATPRPTPTTTEGTTFDDGLVDSIVNFGNDVPERPSDDSSQIVDIVAIITDSTGIVDIVTRPYTGPWPPVDSDDAEGVTLPFAKPGETFEPGSLVGLGQNVNLGTTPADTFQAGDLPPEEELQAAAGVTAAPGAEPIITTAATTPATPAGSTPSTAESTAAEPPPADGDPLGPLSAVPVMDQSQDYIGDVDYDQHLMPALMPIRPGTKADGVQTNVEGSGAAEDGPAADADAAGEVFRVGIESDAADDLLELAQDLTEGSGVAILRDDEGDHQEQQSAPTEDKEQAKQELEKSELQSESEPKPESESESGNRKPSRPAPVSGVAFQRPPVSGGPKGSHGSLSTSIGQPSCGVMGSSLATLLARNRFRPRIDDSPEGGEVTSAVVWCWMAAIMRKTRDPENPYSFVCSGTLVERDLVVTTASCASRLFQEPLRDFVVLLGASNLRVNLEFGVQHMELDEIIVHEDYQINSHVHANNIGLLKLSRPALLERTVCLLCLPPENMELTGRQSCAVTGYGLADSRDAATTQQQAAAPELAGVLRQTHVPVMGGEQCRASGAMQRLASALPGLDERSFLCAGGRRFADACHISRDGSSPLACMAAENGRYYLYGHIARDAECGDTSQPHVYTNVASLFGWIRDNYGRMARKAAAPAR